MAKVYANRIKLGLMTLEQVPLKYREEVKKLLGE